ncbi:MAG: hypothetical protein ABJE47_17020 [bacterium]
MPMPKVAMMASWDRGAPTYTANGKNIVIIQCFKEYFGLGFFKRAFEALTPGRQRGYLHHFAAAK